MSLHSDVYSAMQATRLYVSTKLGKHPGRKDILRPLSSFHVGIQQHVDFVLKELASDLPCARGCSCCCNLRVEPIVPEVILMAEAVRNLSPETQDRIRERTRTLASKVRGKAADERLVMREPCPLLVGEICSVYPLRPVPCRIYFSLSKESCIKGQTDPEHAVPVLMDPVIAVSAARVGFQLGLRDAKLPSLAVELISALDAVFETRDPWTDYTKGRVFGELSDTELNLDDSLEDAKRASFARSIISGESFQLQATPKGITERKK